MKRTEALRTLGLDEDATQDDVKAAYKETAQILHPDRFATNRRLQNRATEQFKNLQEAYEFLTKENSNDSDKTSQGPVVYTPESRVAARIAGISAARIQLVKQRDVAIDQRRNGLVMSAIGGVVAVYAGRRPYGFFAAITAIASAAVVWGIFQIASTQRTITTLDQHINKLRAEEKRIKNSLNHED